MPAAPKRLLTLVSELVVSGVMVAFGERTVLDGATLTVATGEIVALLGPSGSGKSTLLRVIAGILTPDRGTVHVGGVDVTRVPTHRRSVGMVFQDEQLFEHLDVHGNVEFGLRMRGDPPETRRRRVVELLELVGLAGFERRSVRQLSGGEAKRVALARSLAPSPSVLLLDEPLTGLDRQLHDRLVDDLGAILRAEGTTSLVVTHDHDEAEAIADRVVMVTELVGSPRETRLSGARDEAPAEERPGAAPAVCGVAGERNDGRGGGGRRALRTAHGGAPSRHAERRRALPPRRRSGDAPPRGA